MHAVEDGAQGRGRVAVDHDFALVVAGHALDAEGLVVGQVFTRPIVSGLGHAEVHVDRLLFAVEIPLQRGLDFIHVDAEEIGQRAHVGEVGHIIAQAEGQIGILHQLLHRDRIVLDILAVVGNGQRVIVQNDAAGEHFFHVLGHGCGVHADLDLHAVAPGQVAVLAQAHVVPSGQTLNIAGE